MGLYNHLFFFALCLTFPFLWFTCSFGGSEEGSTPKATINMELAILSSFGSTMTNKSDQFEIISHFLKSQAKKFYHTWFFNPWKNIAEKNSILSFFLILTLGHMVLKHMIWSRHMRKCLKNTKSNIWPMWLKLIHIYVSFKTDFLLILTILALLKSQNRGFSPKHSPKIDLLPFSDIPNPGSTLAHWPLG